MQGVRTNRSVLAAAGSVLAVALAGCGGGSTAKVLVQDSSSPLLTPSVTPTASTSATPSAGSSSTSSSGGNDAISGGGYYGYGSGVPASTPASTPKPRRTTAKPAAAATTRVTPAPTATKASTACGAGGSTTTIQATTPDRFSPSTVSIKRCDSVKVVYADATGVPHNWQGPGWQSPDLRSQGQSYTYRFQTKGSFNFFCSYHQSAGMTGTVTVS